jgi:predicted AAA+ superfamily ATPase
MSDVVKDQPTTAIFTGPTGCGKTKLVLDLLQNEYKEHFENIVILCPTLRWNRTYLDRKFLWLDDYIFLIDPKQELFA